MGKWIISETDLTSDEETMQRSSLLRQHSRTSVPEVNPEKNQETQQNREWSTVVTASALLGFNLLYTPALTLHRHLVTKI